MEFPGFRRAGEEAAERWTVPALAAGASAGGTTSVVSVGCAPETRFRVASITKPLTATLALALLPLDAPAEVWPDVRVRELLAHTSGYGSEHGDLARFGDGDDALEAAVRELPGVRRWLPAGEVWSYSNAGYWIAGWLAACAAGSTYEDALQAHVLDEAGLAATSFGEPDVAGTGRGSGVGAYPRARRPSGGLVSNVADLLRFGEWQLARPETAALRVVAGKPPGGVYGLGFFGERVGGVDVWGHGGSYGGFQSSLLLVPARGAVFAGLTNSGRGAQALREVEDVWLETVVGERRRVPPTVEVAPDALDAVAGTYRNGEAEARVVRSGNSLRVVVVDGEGEQESAARAIGERTFELTDGDLARYRVDFPRPGLARVGARLAERVE